MSGDTLITNISSFDAVEIDNSDDEGTCIVLSKYHPQGSVDLGNPATMTHERQTNWKLSAGVQPPYSQFSGEYGRNSTEGVKGDVWANCNGLFIHPDTLRWVLKDTKGIGLGLHGPSMCRAQFELPRNHSHKLKTAMKITCSFRPEHDGDSRGGKHEFPDDGNFRTIIFDVMGKSKTSKVKLKR